MNGQRKGSRWSMRKLIVLLCLTLTFGLAAAQANAAGLLIADGGLGGVLEIKEQDVKVVINNGVAVTTVTQVFRNTENRQVEALYTFPVPRAASVANFSMWINGKEMVGEVVEKKRAREIYDSYRAKRRDPGLLEQTDYKTFEMRIFPINAGAEQKVQISYYQELGIDNDEATYVYPLATVTRRDINSRTTGKFSMTVDVKSLIPVTSLASPSHIKDFVVSRHDSSYYRASMEKPSGSLAEDVVLHYRLSRPRTGTDILTSKTGKDDGHFLLTLTAGKELERLNTGMDYVFVVDISGSMADSGKLRISADQVNAFIDALAGDDRFEVLTFNVQPSTLFRTLQPVTDDAKARAKAFLDSQEARGGTNLLPAMSTAYKYANPDRTLNVVVLSDGMTEQAERQTLLQLIQSRPKSSRVFCIGIGNEINRPLLEQLADDSGGIAAFVSQGDDFVRQAKAFRRKLMHPAVADIRLDFGGLQVYDVEPAQAPNLYHGAPVRIYGRYKGGGKAKVTFRGTVFGREVSETALLELPAADAGNPEIERMWALKRVDQLLKNADRSGSRQQVADEIIRLGEGYSIVTEYTSFLVLENDAEYQRWKIDRRNGQRIERDRTAQDTRDRDLESIRNKAIAAIGPEPAAQGAEATPGQTAQPSQPGLQPRPADSKSVDFNFGPNRSIGSGPVGPLFLAAAWWLRRQMRRDSR